MVDYYALILLFVLLAFGVPVAVSLALSGIVGIALIAGWPTAMNLLTLLPHRIVATYVLIAIPMFLFFGYLAETTNIITGTFEAAKKWAGRVPGGLAIATTGASGAFAAASGSSISSCVIFGRLAVPEMRRAGYSKSLSVGTVASAGLIDSTIPPSLTLLLYGMLSETSVIKLFTAGIIPGALQMFTIMGTIWILYRIRREHFPADTELSSASWAEKFRSLSGVWPLFSVAVAILASIYLGIATITESAAAGVIVAIAISIAQRRASLHLLWDTARKTAETTSMILMILVGGVIFSTYIAMTGVSSVIVEAIAALPLSGTMILILLIPAFLVLGCFLDGASILVLTVPLMLPVAAHYQIDPIFLGIYITFCIGLGALTPPVGINVFAVKSTVPDISLEEAFRSILPFFLSLGLLLVVLILFPGLVTWLPSVVNVR